MRRAVKKRKATALTMIKTTKLPHTCNESVQPTSAALN